MSKVTYNNSLTTIAKTRIMADRNLVTKDKNGYKDSDIYFDFNKEKIENLFRILMIGSQDLDNPYFGGFFTFKGKFPDQYPFYPPHVLAMTQGENTRFHPNYYVSGKCCLSILGTWSGPPWTSCQNLGTVSQSLKMLYIDNPITQEPSWEKCVDERAKTYKRIIAYRTLQVAVIKMLNHPPKNFEVFIPIMEKYFLKLYPKYMEKIDKMKQLHNKVENSPIYGMKVTYNITKLQNQFETKYQELSKKYPSEIVNDTSKKDLNINSSETIELKNTITESDILEIKSNIKKNIKKRVPDQPAKNFELGHTLVSKYNGSLYQVTKNVKGHKRWKKVTVNI